MPTDLDIQELLKKCVHQVSTDVNVIFGTIIVEDIRVPTDLFNESERTNEMEQDKEIEIDESDPENDENLAESNETVVKKNSSMS